MATTDADARATAPLRRSKRDGTHTGREGRRELPSSRNAQTSPGRPSLAFGRGVMASSTCLLVMGVMAFASLPTSVHAQSSSSSSGTLTFRTYEDSVEPLKEAVPEIAGAVTYEVGCEPAKASLFRFLNNATEDPGAFEYLPAPNEFSKDFRDKDVFSYYGVYEDGTQSELRVAFVYIFPVNDPPIAANGEEYVVYNGVSDGVVPNNVQDEQQRLALRYPYALERQLVATDPDGDRLHYEITRQPVNGNVTVDADGNFKYVPLPGFTGEDRFGYSVDDRLGNGKPDGGNDPFFTANATVVVMTGVQDGLPLVLPDAFATFEDTPLLRQPISRGATSNAGLVPLLRYRISRQGKFGVATVVCDGKETNDPATCEEDAARRVSGRAYFSYTPNKDAFGTDEFEVELYVADKEDEFPSTPDQRALMTIEIAPVNDAPVVYAALGESAMYNPQAALPYNASASLVPVRVFDVDNSTATVKLRLVPVEGWFNGVEAPEDASYGVADSDVGKFYSAVDPKTGAPVGAPLNLRGAGITMNVSGVDAPGGANVMIYHVPPPFKRGHPLTTLAVEASDGFLVSNRSDVSVSTQCIPGFSVDSKDLTLCAPCASGTFSIPKDAGACSLCQAGFSSKAFATKCEICSPGTYAPAPGTPECISCGYGATSPAGSDSKTQCFCLRGHYGGLGKPCEACPNPSVPMFDGLKTTINTTMERLKADGLKVQGDLDKVAEAAAISIFAQYDDGVISSGTDGDNIKLWTKCIFDNQTLPLPFGGFYVNPRVNDDPVELRECFPPDACKGLDKYSDIALIESRMTCTNGYEGKACAECKNGFFRLSGRCQECPAGGVQAGIVIAWVSVMALPLLLRFADFDSGYAPLDIAIGFTQTTSIYLKMNLNWPESLRRFFEAASIFNLNWELLHIDCNDSSWTFGKKWSYTMIQPWVILGLVLFIQLLNFLHKVFQRTIGVRIRTAYPWLIEPPEAETNLFKRFGSRVRYAIGKFLIGRVFRTAGVFAGKSVEEFVTDLRTGFKGHLTLMHMQYVYLTIGAFEMWECQRDEVSGDFYLFSEPGIKCYSSSGTWASLYPFAVLTIIALPFGIPMLFGGLLFYFRDEKVRKADAAKELAGFLWTPYEKEYYWWEIVRFLRILGLTAAAMMFQGGQIQDNDPDTSALNEMLLATGVLAMNLGAQYYARPYDDVRLDVMQSVASYTNFFTIFCGLAFLSPRTPSTVRNVLELANLILIGLSYVFFIYTLTVVVFSGAAKALERTLTRFRRRRQLAKGDASMKITNLFDTEYLVRGFGQKLLVGNNIASYLVRMGADVVIYLSRAKLVEMRQIKEIFAGMKKFFDDMRGNKLSVLATTAKTPLHEYFKKEERETLMEGLALNSNVASNKELLEFVEMLEKRRKERTALHKRVGASVADKVSDLKKSATGIMSRSPSKKEETPPAKKGGGAVFQKMMSMEKRPEKKEETEGGILALEDTKGKAPETSEKETSIVLAPAAAPAASSSTTTPTAALPGLETAVLSWNPDTGSPDRPSFLVEPVQAPAPAVVVDVELETKPPEPEKSEPEKPELEPKKPESEPEPELQPQPQLIPAQTAPARSDQIPLSDTPASPERLKLEQEAKEEAAAAAQLAEERIKALEEAERLARERAVALEEAAQHARTAALSKARAATLVAEAEQAELAAAETSAKAGEKEEDSKLVHELAGVVAEADALNDERAAMEEQMKAERMQFLDEKARMEEEIRKQMEELEALQRELDIADEAEKTA